MFFAGLAGAGYGVSTWAATSFGLLSPTQVLRIVIPAGLLLALGCQTVLSSFFMSILGLSVRRSAAK